MRTRVIYLDYNVARKKGLLTSREEWLKKYATIETTSYLDIVKGAPLLVCIEGSYITVDNLHKLLPKYVDRAYVCQWELGIAWVNFKWKRK